MARLLLMAKDVHAKESSAGALPFSQRHPSDNSFFFLPPSPLLTYLCALARSFPRDLCPSRPRIPTAKHLSSPSHHTTPNPQSGWRRQPSTVATVLSSNLFRLSEIPTHHVGRRGKRARIGGHPPVRGNIYPAYGQPGHREACGSKSLLASCILRDSLDYYEL